MQRWHLTAGLAGATALAALVLPTLRGTTISEKPPEVNPDGPDKEPVIVPEAVGSLLLRAELDREALLAGTAQDRYLVVEIEAPDLPDDVRRPVSLAVVMDVSGSMAGRGKIDNARMAAAELVAQLGPQDSFSLITFSDQGRVLQPLGRVEDVARTQRLILGIQPTGGTYLSSGVELGLDQLSDPSIEGVRRVVVLSDGMANIGVTDPVALARAAGQRVEQGISLSTIGLGLDYNEDLLTAMSDTGGGSYHFVDRPGQLASIFQSELHQMSRVAGREVSVDVSLPPGVILHEVYGYSATTTTDGYRVFLGDLHGGETRKVVARVRVEPGAVERFDVALVGLSYHDPETDKAAGRELAVVSAVSKDEQIVQRSVNKQAGVAAAKAHAGLLVDRSARSYAEGDIAGNQADLREAEALLNSLGSDYDAVELKGEAAGVGAQREAFQAAPAASSDEGLYQVKKAKEAARGFSRR